MEAPITLDRQYFTLVKEPTSFSHRVFHFHFFSIKCSQPCVRSANRAGNRLRVKPSIQWIVIFFCAETAKREFAHRRVFTVIWESFDYCETGSAIAAGNEEVFVSWVFRI